MHVIVEATSSTRNFRAMHSHQGNVGVICGNALRTLCFGVHVWLAVNTLYGSEA